VLRRTFAGALAATAMVLPLTAVVSAPSAAAAEIQATSLTFDITRISREADRVSIRSAADVWNRSVSNVQLKEATSGQRVNIRIQDDSGWPRATLGPVRPAGTVTIWMGRQAIDGPNGYNVVRIAAHEMGHSLGLPDIKPGPCSSLMSGSTAGTSCTNPNPNASEKARVQSNYAGTLKTQDVSDSVVIEDAAF
jgi:snapalysin